MNNAALKAQPAADAHLRVGVLLPLPLKGPYDYRLEAPLPRGTLVLAPLGPREAFGVVWCESEGAVDDAKLKTAVPLDGAPRLPEALCDFIDWVARYTLNPPGVVLALALRARQAFEPETMRIAYVRGGTTPSRMTAARQRVLGVTADGLARSMSAIAEDANVTPSVVRGLIDAGALVETDLPEFAPLPVPDPDATQPALNDEQTVAADALIAAVKARDFSVALLDGVTGSGKTETYFEAVAEALRHNRQVLILLPEIALTVQFLDRFAERFGCRPAEWHSDLSQKERRRIYRAVLRGEARIVVGARSALFLPFSDLGLIIIDEEHEQAYKQEDGVIYHARDMAVVRGASGELPGDPGQRHAVAGDLRQRLERTLPLAEAVEPSRRCGDAGRPSHRSQERSAGVRKLDFAAIAGSARNDHRQRRAGDAVSQSPRLCAAHAVRHLRPQDGLPQLFGMAGRASLSQETRLPSLRL